MDTFPVKDRRDITSYRTTLEIFRSELFTPEERRREYRCRSKSPSGFIDGVYNDSQREFGVPGQRSFSAIPFPQVVMEISLGLEKSGRIPTGRP